jgi:hypothetical protein
MTSPYLELLAADRSRELCREAAAARLVALVLCCRPSAWGRAARRATAAVTALRSTLQRGRPIAAPCCP